MTKDITYTLKWKHFPPKVTSRVSDVFTKNIFCDVTLVSDDQKPFLAHRYVLSSFSPVLKNMLLDNPHSHPLIYLRGINHQELDSILQFIYLRKASVKQSNMKRFAQAAKDLQIKKLTENLRMGNSLEPTGDQDNNDDKGKDDIHEDNEDLTALRSIPDIADKTIKFDLTGSDERMSSKQLYKCKECEARFKGKSGLHYHTNSKHRGICYSCEYCGYKTTAQSRFKIHQESIHQGIKYFCDQCDYQFTQRRHLNAHKKSVHEGVKYSCDQCDFQTAHHVNLKTHKNSVHDGVKYPCDQCDYQATRQVNLKTHKKSVHEGVRYFCDMCNYHTGWKSDLIKHKSREHRHPH